MATTNTPPNSLLPDDVSASLTFILKDYSCSPAQRPPRLSEEQVDRISQLLAQAGKVTWSRTPRIYAVLHMVDSVRDIDTFQKAQVSDLWFPFSIRTLPDDFRSPSHRAAFIEFQDFVLTKAFDLEREDGKHRHFANPAEIPLIKKAELGKGGFGSVDRVLSTITYREYARKLIPKGKTFRRNVSMLRDFESELGLLKKVRHEHIVRLVGSYTDPKYLGLLMTPVADRNLREFLTQSPLAPAERSLLRTFYGCLATALDYLHENQIKHKDIKPQNILVKGHQVFLTDFGIALDWSEHGQSTTTGPSTGRTPKYCAPEVGNDLRRNSLADLWSLGCVFLEMWTILKGETLAHLDHHLAHFGTSSPCYYRNLAGIKEWCDHLQGRQTSSYENQPREWIQGTLEDDQDQRWTARILVTKILEANERDETPVLFVGNCCSHQDDDSVTSAFSSRPTSQMLEETGASSIEVYEPESKALADPEHESSATSQALTPTVDASLQHDIDPSSETPELYAASSVVSKTWSQYTTTARVPTPMRQHIGGALAESVTSTVPSKSSNIPRRKPVNSHIASLSSFSTLQRTVRPSQSHSPQLPVRDHENSTFVEEMQPSPMKNDHISHQSERSSSSVQESPVVGSVSNVAENVNQTLHSQTPYTQQISPPQQYEGRKLSTDQARIQSDYETVEAEKRLKLDWKGSVSLDGEEYRVATLAFSPANKILVSGTYSRMIQTWNVVTGNMLRTGPHGIEQVVSAAISPDATLVAWSTTTIYKQARIEVEYTATGSDRWMSSCISDTTVLALAFAHRSDYLVSAGSSGPVLLWDMTTTFHSGPIGKFVSIHVKGAICAVAFSPNDKLVASCATSGQIVLWDTLTGIALHNLNTHTRRNEPIVFCSDVLLASIGQLGMIVWNTTTGRADSQPKGAMNLAFPIASSSHHKLVAGYDYKRRSILVFDMEAGIEVGHSDLMFREPVPVALAFSPNGQVLASASWKGQIRLRQIRPTKASPFLVGKLKTILK